MEGFIKTQNDINQTLSNEFNDSLSDEQRIILTDWFKIYTNNNEKLPLRSDFPPPKYYKQMPSVVIFEIHHDPLDFKYGLVGTNVTLHSTADFTGKMISTLSGKGPGSGIWNMLSATMNEKVPLFKEVPYVGPHSNFVRSTVLFLPLANKKQEVDKIFLVTNFIRTV